jgi:hypothetical protein
MEVKNPSKHALLSERFLAILKAEAIANAYLQGTDRFEGPACSAAVAECNILTCCAWKSLVQDRLASLIKIAYVHYFCGQWFRAVVAVQVISLALPIPFFRPLHIDDRPSRGIPLCSSLAAQISARFRLKLAPVPISVSARPRTAENQVQSNWVGQS